jgi:hypothetical protein
MISFLPGTIPVILLLQKRQDMIEIGIIFSPE